MRRVTQCTESHYLKCINENCEIFACVARRELEFKLGEKEDEIFRLRDVIEELKLEKYHLKLLVKP